MIRQSSREIGLMSGHYRGNFPLGGAGPSCFTGVYHPTSAIYIHSPSSRSLSPLICGAARATKSCARIRLLLCDASIVHGDDVAECLISDCWGTTISHVRSDCRFRGFMVLYIGGGWIFFFGRLLLRILFWKWICNLLLGVGYFTLELKFEYIHVSDFN